MGGLKGVKMSMRKWFAVQRRTYLVFISTVFLVGIAIFPIFLTGCGGGQTPEYTLLVSVEPAGAGTVFFEPSGPSYKKGTIVTLTALEEDDNYAFSHWTGSLTGNENPADIVMNANKSVTAHFGELGYKLKIEIEGNGTVARRIVGGGEGAGPVQIELTPQPSPGWIFAEWTGDLSGRDNPAILVLDGDKTITAHFTDDHSEITGTITFRRSGSGVAGATVTIVKSEDGTKIDSTETDSKGRYSFLVEPGIEIDLIATKEGFAGSRFQGIVASGGESFRADLIMQEPTTPGEDTTPPSLQITGVTSGQAISGTLNLSVKLETGGFPPDNFYIDIGAESNIHSFRFTGDSSNVVLDTSRYPNGLSFIYIAAYDLNMNCVITRIPVTIKNDASPGNPLTMKKRLRVVAYTKGDDMHMQTASMEWPDSFRNSPLHQKGLPPALEDISITAAEARSACYVELRWEKEFSDNSGFLGYNVYRSLSAKGPWQQLGVASEDSENEEFYFRDTTPDVTPGVRLYYKVVPYSRGGVEGSGQTQWVVPLGRFEVNLRAPAHEAKGVPLNPTLEWVHNGLEADGYYYGLVLTSVAEDPRQAASYLLVTIDKNETSVVYDDVYENPDDIWEGYFDLKSNWKYQWDVVYAEAVRIYDYAKTSDGGYIFYSVARSWAQKGNHSTEGQGSYNGAFVFTTTGEGE